MAVGGFVVPCPAAHRLGRHRSDAGVTDLTQGRYRADGQEGRSDRIVAIADAQGRSIPGHTGEAVLLCAHATK